MKTLFPCLKTLMLLVSVLTSVCVYSQDIVNFKLQSDGSFLTEEGQDYVIVPFEDKSAHEIYQSLAVNIGTVFNDPSKVMSGVEDASIKIRAIIPIVRKIVKLLGQEALAESKGYVQIEIRIKDGRVRLSSPFIENEIWMDGMGSGNFRNLTSKWFKYEKKEKKRQENEANIKDLEIRVNSIINTILGLNLNTKVDDDW